MTSSLWTSSITPVSPPAVSEAGFSSGTEEETSGYESEGGHSLSTDCTSTSSPASPPSGRRPRTAFTAEQISSMERAFKRNAYLGTQDKAELCKKLSLSDKQVTILHLVPIINQWESISDRDYFKCWYWTELFLMRLSIPPPQIRNWFQNRRMKLKRTVQDALAHACQANVASQLMHYPELQAYRPGPYPRYHSAAVAAAEGPSAASYVHPHGLQYSSPLPSVSALPLDSFYQYSSLPGVLLPSTTPQLMGSYPAYHQYYWYRPARWACAATFIFTVRQNETESSYPNRIDATRDGRRQSCCCECWIRNKQGAVQYWCELCVYLM